MCKIRIVTWILGVFQVVCLKQLLWSIIFLLVWSHTKAFCLIIEEWFYKSLNEKIFSLTKMTFSSLSVWALPMPETKIWDHFSIQIYPLLVGNMASETTFGHWKVVFSWGKGRKMTFSQNPLKTRFWASGFWMSILSSANFKKDPPWNIFFLSVHAPATSG